MSRLPRNAAPNEPAYPTSSVDPRFEMSLWLLMSVEELKAKLKAERKRALKGHWTYDANRHRLMLAALKIVKSKAREAP